MALEIREVIKYGDNKECHRADQIDDEGIVSKIKPKDIPLMGQQQLIIFVPQDVRHMQADKYIKEVECGNDGIDNQHGANKNCESMDMVSSE